MHAQGLCLRSAHSLPARRMSTACAACAPPTLSPMARACRHASSASVEKAWCAWSSVICSRSST